MSSSRCGRTLAGVWLGALLITGLAGIPAGMAGFVPVETEEQDPARLSSSLRTPQGLYPGVVALTSTSANWKDAQAKDKGFLHHCTGLLVKPQWVLTEAYCIDELKSFDQATESLRVLHGDVDLQKAKSVAIKRVIKHPDYRTSSGAPINSLALLELAEALPEAAIVLSREEPVAKEQAQGDLGSAVVVGWGEFFDNEPKGFLHLQRHLSVRLIPRETCNVTMNGQVEASMICADSGFKRIDVCSAFGGSPLMIPNARGRLQAVGMVSWGIRCAEQPTVYTGLATYLPWIETEIGSLPSDAPLARPEGRPEKQVFDDPGAQMRALNPNANVAPQDMFRYMVSIGEPDPSNPLILNQGLIHKCGGVLLHRRWVLTAAHCVAHAVSNPAKLQLKIESAVLSRGGKFLHAKRILVHPKYQVTMQKSPVNDLALIEIQEEIKDIDPPPFVDPVWERQLLGATGEAPRDVVVLGWGRKGTSRVDTHTDYLHWTAIRIIERKICNGPNSYNGRIDDDVYCAGKPDADSCEGDSGGPLMVPDPAAFILIGLVSWGDGCGKNDKPGVYVRLSRYNDWILDSMQK